MKVMLNRNITPAERINNMFNKNICPNFVNAWTSAVRAEKCNLNLTLDQTKHDYFIEFTDIDKREALTIILELQENGNRLPFVCNMYNRVEKKLVLQLSEECGLTYALAIKAKGIV